MGCTGLFSRQSQGELMAEPSSASPLHAEALLFKCPFVAVREYFCFGRFYFLV